MTKEVAEAVGGLKNLVPTGTSVLVEGELTATPEGTKQVGQARTHPCGWAGRAVGERGLVCAPVQGVHLVSGAARTALSRP